MIERYARSEMRALWSDASRYALWLDVELAVCQAMEGEGLVPEGTAQRIATSVELDPTRVQAIEEEVRHDVIAFLTHVEEQAGEAARWLHLGLTSSDVLDTAFALQLQQAGAILLDGLDAVLRALRARAYEFKGQAVIGRTHGIHAEPTSLGLVFASFYAEMMRNRVRLERALEGLAFGKLAGAVGVYGTLAPRIESAALAELGLAPEPCATQVVPRDRHAELFSVLALLAAAVERIALQVRHWQRTEVGEAREPFGGAQKGSSAMPHKRNPILSENLCGLARLVRSHIGPALENIVLWHERDISHSSVERVLAPDAMTLVDFMLYRLRGLIEGLVVDRQRVNENLLRSRGLVFSEAVLLALVRQGMSRQQAYAVVQRHALAAVDRGEDFAALLGADGEVRARLSSDELAACFDLAHHLQHVDAIFARVFGA